MEKEFINWSFPQKPSPKEMRDVLSTVPAWTGSKKTLADYMEYVVAIPSAWGNKVEWRLYMSVSGKQKILRDAHVKENGEIVPLVESIEIKIVGNTVIVQGTLESPIYGKVFEAATGVIGSEAKGADRSNPIENAITSWRGRAASALCCAGVMPMSIASVEEVIEAYKRGVDSIAIEEERPRLNRIVPPSAQQSQQSQQPQQSKQVTQAPQVAKAQEEGADDKSQDKPKLGGELHENEYFDSNRESDSVGSVTPLHIHNDDYDDNASEEPQDHQNDKMAVSESEQQARGGMEQGEDNETEVKPKTERPVMRTSGQVLSKGAIDNIVATHIAVIGDEDEYWKVVKEFVEENGIAENPTIDDIKYNIIYQFDGYKLGKIFAVVNKRKRELEQLSKNPAQQ